MGLLLPPRICAQTKFQRKRQQALAEMERVIVTGSNIPTAAETGRIQWTPIDRLISKNWASQRNGPAYQSAPGDGHDHQPEPIDGGDGAVIPNLRGLLPKETLVLIDGKRVAIVGIGGAVSAVAIGPAGVDINLIPFPMIDHIDILKDGASAVYGSDAVAGVINIFLLHKFRGLEIGGSIGNTNLGASNDARELEGWLKAGAGDDKTDILVIADFYDRAAMYSRDRDLDCNAFAIPWGGFDFRSASFPGRIGTDSWFSLDPEVVFQCELSTTALSA